MSLHFNMHVAGMCRVAANTRLQHQLNAQRACHVLSEMVKIADPAADTSPYSDKASLHTLHGSSFPANKPSEPGQHGHVVGADKPSAPSWHQQWHAADAGPDAKAYREGVEPPSKRKASCQCESGETSRERQTQQQAGENACEEQDAARFELDQLSSEGQQHSRNRSMCNSEDAIAGTTSGSLHKAHQHLSCHEDATSASQADSHPESCQHSRDRHGASNEQNYTDALLPSDHDHRVASDSWCSPHIWDGRGSCLLGDDVSRHAGVHAWQPLDQSHWVAHARLAVQTASRWCHTLPDQPFTL